jgi:hypothetical protein
MKSLIIAFTLFAGASTVKIVFDVWDLIFRVKLEPACIVGVKPVSTDQKTFVIDGPVVCNLTGP